MYELNFQRFTVHTGITRKNEIFPGKQLKKNGPEYQCKEKQTLNLYTGIYCLQICYTVDIPVMDPDKKKTDLIRQGSWSPTYRWWLPKSIIDKSRDEDPDPDPLLFQRIRILPVTTDKLNYFHLE